MNIRKYYIDDQPGGGGGDKPAPQAPKDYKGISPQMRQDWNGFLDYLDKKGVGGSAALDKRDQSLGLTYLNQYRKENPTTSITPDIIPQIQYDQYLLRKGDAYPGLNSEQLKYVRNGLNPAYMARAVSDTDGWLGSLTSKQYYPTAKRGTNTGDSYDFGTNMEDYVNSLHNPELANKYKVPPPNIPAGHGPPDIGLSNEEYNNGVPSSPGTAVKNIEGHASTNVGLAPTSQPVAGVDAPAPSKVAPLPITGAPAPPVNANLIPRPDYNNPASRTAFLQNWQKKYGSLEGRGDTVLKVNETPRGASDTAKNITTKIAKQYGLDPALLYSSSMEEGMSGLFKDKSGLDTKHRKPGDFGYQDDFGNKEFPINGNQSFGLPDFYNRFPELVKGGYLPKEFASRFKGGDAENNFKTTDDALKAKAALMKYTYDDVDKYATKAGITLSPKAKDFFALAEFNAGEGGFHKLLKEYQSKGLLQNDQFLKENPHKGEKIPENQDIYAHVIRRLKMRDNLKEQQLFN